jgi:hypothetical protein
VKKAVSGNKWVCNMYIGGAWSLFVFSEIQLKREIWGDYIFSFCFYPFSNLSSFYLCL